MEKKKTLKVKVLMKCTDKIRSTHIIKKTYTYILSFHPTQKENKDKISYELLYSIAQEYYNTNMTNLTTYEMCDDHPPPY